eukprot:jgi/Mesen1/9646/ME000067S09029
MKKQEMFRLMLPDTDGSELKGRRFRPTPTLRRKIVPWIDEKPEIESEHKVGVSYQICAVELEFLAGYGSGWWQVGGGFSTRPPMGTKVYELVNFIKQTHAGSLGLYVCHESIPFYVCTLEGELAAGDEKLEDHAPVICDESGKRVEEDAFFFIVVPLLPRWECLGIQANLLRLSGVYLSESCFHFNIDTSNRMPKVLGPKDWLLREKKVTEVSHVYRGRQMIHHRGRSLSAGSNGCHAL